MPGRGVTGRAPGPPFTIVYAYRQAKDQQTRRDARPISEARPAAAADDKTKAFARRLYSRQRWR